MKYGKHAWPTDGVTKKQLDRESDRAKIRHERQQKSIEKLAVRLRRVEAILSKITIGREEE